MPSSSSVSSASPSPVAAPSAEPSVSRHGVSAAGPTHGYCHACGVEATIKFSEEDMEFHCTTCSATCVELMEEGVALPWASSQASAASTSASVDPARQPSSSFVSTAPPPTASRSAAPPSAPLPSMVPPSSTVPSRAGRMAPTSLPPTSSPPRIPQRMPHHSHRMPNQTNFGVICDACQARDFPGVRYRCCTCLDYDLCSDCYPQRQSFHPDHQFEALRPGLMPTVFTVVEINLEEEAEVDTGLTEAQVAWWLADQRRLACFSGLSSQDPPWSCPICSEGLEAEHCHGWVVRICDEKCDDTSAADAAGETTALGGENKTSPKTEAVDDRTDGHTYHETCLRRWLVLKNACPVCRRSPVVFEA
eukprot:TRINITY_DN50491_c0_g1_i1.p1 TRINITY_DN50491_c0_g1~~TRINITY_DN50491_c0_g1_i1.p1  ORF type:complete len:411 (+),score=77.63 TRINITY_DN50491_c0_g1_i1:148-1233(+)